MNPYWTEYEAITGNKITFWKVAKMRVAHLVGGCDKLCPWCYCYEHIQEAATEQRNRKFPQ